ncbi:pentapeptide repeat-containing protein [Vibrio rarus]|uniref:pentapeptide repeat-containing protein n=1 Tax=Vibrio rarus TaxID=413403 RepID=UPI0021C379A2|nr:pentapeptide repeat-containing protein [Vibrio rarus]
MKNQQQYYDEHFAKQTDIAQIFHDIEFEECEFVDCDFSETQFKHCQFINCRFVRCNLSLIKVPNCRWYQVTFCESKLVGIDWTTAHWPSFHADNELTFKQCILNDCSWFGLTLQELTMVECKLHDADFREGDFSSSTLTYCDFTHSLFMRSNLEKVNFTESSNMAIDLNNNRLAGAKFSRYEALSLLDSLDIELVD